MELQSANQRLSVLQIEHSRLQSSLADSRTALETQGVTAKSEERQRLHRADQERQSDRRKILELESQVQVARQAATRLEQELSSSRKNEMNALEEARIARLRSHNSPRVTFNSSTKDGPPSTPPPPPPTVSMTIDLKHCYCCNLLLLLSVTVITYYYWCNCNLSQS